MRHRTLTSTSPLIISLLILLSAAATPSAQGAKPAPTAKAARVAEIAPKFYVVSNATGNLVLFVGEDASFVAGPQYPALVNEAVAKLRDLKAPPVKYVLIADDEHAATLLDGGWGHRGAVTLAHEALYGSMRSPKAGTNGVVAAPGAAPPAMGFSQVVQLHIKGEDTHIIHDKVGYTAADAVIHFEGSGIAWLGPAFTSDGYPRIDVARGGKLSGMIELVDFFATSFAGAPQAIEPIIPGRGPIATIRDLQEYRDMLRAVRERVIALVKSGKSAQEAIAAKPTAEFDAKWGHGPVSPDQFVAMAYESVRKE